MGVSAGILPNQIPAVFLTGGLFQLPAGLLHTSAYGFRWLGIARYPEALSELHTLIHRPCHMGVFGLRAGVRTFGLGSLAASSPHVQRVECYC